MKAVQQRVNGDKAPYNKIANQKYTAAVYRDGEQLNYGNKYKGLSNG